MKLSEKKQKEYLATIEEMNRKWREELESFRKATITENVEIDVDDVVLVKARKRFDGGRAYGKWIEKEVTVKRLDIQHIRKSYTNHILLRFTCHEENRWHEVGHVIEIIKKANHE
jgi:hypothetical protein